MWSAMYQFNFVLFLWLYGVHVACIVACRCETVSSLAVPCREKERAAQVEVDRKEAEREVWFQALPD